MRKCSGCKLPVDQWPIKPYSSMTKTCSVSCALDLVERKKDKQFKSETRAMKVKMLDNDSKFWKAKAQQAFNEFIRLRDAEIPCISCGKGAGLSGKWNAGHFHSVGARGDLRFNEDNCHKQCEHCNSFKSGNISLYTPNLILKIGQERFDALIVPKTQSYRIEDYKRIHEEYKMKIKELKVN